MRFISIIVIALFAYNYSSGQGCCSGGAGSPIAGGAATGVLQKNQMEFSAIYQHSKSNKFFTGDHYTDPLFNNFHSNYLYFRIDYGMSDKLTISVASGYYLNKTLNELESDKELSSEGIGDLLIIPRYDIYNKTKNKKQTEITLGMGLKIPLGSHSESYLVFTHPTVGDVYTILPPTVQTSTGSNDFLFNAFFFRGYQVKKLRVFANSIYIRKGYNDLGIKFGDYASLGLFIGKTFFGNLGITMQVKGEWVGKMEAGEGIDLLAEYNIDQESTGSRKIFFVPQISYTVKSLTGFVTSEIPLYQHLEGTQIGSQYQLTFGLSYRFFVKKPIPEVELQNSEFN